MPPAMALLTFLGYLVVGPSGRQVLAGGVPINDALTPALQLAFCVGIIGLAVTLAGAVPMVSWLMRRGRLRLSQLLVFGCLIGNVPFVLIVVGIVLAALAGGSLSGVARHWYGAAGAFRFVSIGTLHGAVAAVVFWLVVVRGRETETVSS